MNAEATHDPPLHTWPAAQPDVGVQAVAQAVVDVQR